MPEDQRRRSQRSRIQTDSGAIDTVGPQEIAKAFETKETAIRRIGRGLPAATVSEIKNCREKKTVGHTEDGEGVSLRTQCTDAKKAVGSVHKMNVGSNVLALDGDNSYTQNKETSEKAKINYAQGQCVTRVRAPVKEGEVAKEGERS